MIRPCTYDDIPAVMDVNETTLPENYPLFFYEQILEKYPKTFLIAHEIEDPKKIFGYVMWRVERRPSSFGLSYVKKAHLVSLAVLNDCRRQGVANSLLFESMKLIQENNISEYVLEVRVSNGGAIKLYENLHNYKKIRIISNYYRDGEDAFYMSVKNDQKMHSHKNTVGITEKEIIHHFLNKNQGYLLYRCPKCDSLLIKGSSFAFPGSIDSNNDSTLFCQECNNELSLFEITMGKFNINT